MENLTKIDLWNPTVRLINKTKDQEIKNKATMLLNQYNTAGGILMENELHNFLIQNRCVL